MNFIPLHSIPVAYSLLHVVNVSLGHFLLLKCIYRIGGFT